MLRMINDRVALGMSLDSVGDNDKDEMIIYLRKMVNHLKKELAETENLQMFNEVI